MTAEEQDRLTYFNRESYLDPPQEVELDAAALEDLYVACQDFLAKVDTGSISHNRPYIDESYQLMDAATKKARREP